jgi:hypothetical protein
MSFFHALLTAAQAEAQLAFSGSTVSFQNSYTEEENNNPQNNNIYFPCVYYDNGKTYFTYQREYSISPYGQAGLLVYDGARGFDKPRLFGKILSASGDVHSVPSVVVHGSRVYVGQEDLHNTPINLYKGMYDDDYDDSTTLGETISTQAAYPQFLKKADGNFMLFCRFIDGSSNYVMGIVHAASGMESWGSRTLITATPATGYRHYPSTPYNYYANGWYHFVITHREEATTECEYAYLLKTQDFTTWYNYQESYSTASLPIADATLQTNFKYHSIGGQTWFPVAALTPSGKFYSINGDGAGGTLFYYWNGSAWASRTVSITGLRDGASIPFDSQRGPVCSMTAYASNRIEILARVTDGAFYKIHRFVTADEGQNWTDLGDMFPDVSDNIWVAQFPANILEIPDNSNFAVYGSSLTSSGILRGRRCAFGTVQSEPNAAISPAVSDPDSIANAVFGYEANASALSLSGANITTLLDQSSAARNAATSGSPQWDSVNSEIVFDGTNDYAIIPTTGLTALSRFTLCFVAKANGGASVIMSMGNSGSNSPFVSFLISTNAYQKAQGSTYGYYVKRQTAGNDNAHHIFTYVIGFNKVYCYIDGALQYWEFTDNAAQYAASRGDVGNFVNNLSPAINLCTLGALRRTTFAYSASRLKEIWGYSRSLPHTERRGLEEHLAAKWGITLGSQFQ